MNNKFHSKKVLHVITALNNGGAEGVLFRLCVNDKANQHIIISLMDMGKYGPLLTNKGIEVYCLNMPQGRVTLSGLGKLYRLFKMLKPDIVQTWMYHADLIGGVVAKLAGIKNVFWNIRQTTLAKGIFKKSTIYIAKLCALLSYFVPTKIVCCASRAAEVHIGLGYKKSKIEIVGNGYELDRLSINDQQGSIIKTQLLLNNTQHILGMVGRYNPIKDHSNLLGALSLVKDKGINFKCLLVGKLINLENKPLVDEIKKFNLYESILLLDQRSDIPAIMNALDIHVLSSNTEGFPNALAEAMACGTPCVTTDVGDAGLIVGETGWIVPPSDAEALASAILSAIDAQADNESWKVCQQAARQRIVENFSIEEMINNYHVVWSL
jgi:glycosyltransferase involved in cell wall biosynthesis